MEAILRTRGLSKIPRTGGMPVRKSKIAIFWENNPNGIIKVIDRRAVNK